MGKLRNYEMSRRRQILAARGQEESHVCEVPKPLPLEQMADDILAEMYKDQYGKAPHGRMKRAKMIEKLHDALNLST